MLFAVQVVKAPNRQPDERQREEATSGEPEDPRWVRPAAVSLLTATAVLYLWGLGASGWANSFYSAAAQAGSVSWKAFLFGSSDAANSITVDKTPLSLWPMALSIRIFGLNAWSILVPQALEGVAAVGVLYLTVKRWFGATATVVGAMLAVAFAGQGAYALNTARTPHSGSLPTAGPAGRFGMGGPGGGRFGGPGRGNGGVPQGGGVPAFPGGLAPGGVVPGGGGFPGGPGTFGPGGGGLPGGNPGGTNGGFSLPTGGLPGAGGANGGGNRAGGLLQGSEPSAELTALLEKGADEFDWIAATVGANSASGYQLATERPVMPIGGFNGTDPSPTLTQFKAYVSEGRIHYFIAGGGGVGGPGGSETSSEITTWVQQTFTSRTVGGVTVYDLTDPTA